MSTPHRSTDLLAELPRLRRYARVLTGDSHLADCLVEETLLRFRSAAGEATRSRGQYLELLALLREVSAQTAAGRLPAALQAANPRVAGETTPLPGAGSAAAALQVPGRTAAHSLPERTTQVLAQLGELSPEHREILLLAALERLSHVDIAKLLRIPVATVLSRLAEARGALHEIATKSRPAPHNAG